MHCKIQLVMCTDDGRGTYAVVRYADDLAVFSPTPAEAVEGQRRLSAWLGTRGWRWSDEKTHIRHLREGFNFLGFTIRHYPTPQRSRSRYTLLLKPSQISLPQMKWKRKGLWHTPVGSPTVALINAMNPVSRGWSYSFRTGVSKKVCTEWDRFMDERAQREMKRRHPRKSGWGRTQQYGGQTIGRQDRWVFQDKERPGTLRKFAWTTIVRHRLVPTTDAPDAPTLQDDWKQRRRRAHATAGRAGQLAWRQQGLCPVCHQALENGEERHMHHVVPKKHGGTDDLANLRLVHHTCHRQIHRTRAPLWGTSMA